MIKYTESVIGERWTAAQLDRQMKLLGFGPSDLARALRTPLRTIQDWLAGRSKIPGIAQVAVALYSERDKWVVDYIVKSEVEHAVKQYPGMFKIIEKIIDTC